MVILIGAASCAGKTIMAQKLLEKYKMPYFSVDHLKMGLYRADHHCGFTPKSSNEMIEHKIWPIIKGIIMTNIENGQNLIIEGCYLFPERLKEFDGYYARHIIPVFMGFSAQYIKKNFFAGIVAHRSDIELREEPETRTVEQIIAENELFKRMCVESSVHYFEIDEDFERDTEKIYLWIHDRASMEVKHFPVLETPRFLLRRLSEQDAKDVYRYFSKEEVVKYYDLDVFTDISQATEIIHRWNNRFEEDRGIRWGIAKKDDHEIIGSCGFFNWSKKDDRAEIGYELDPEYWNKGIMTEVIGVALKFAFSQWNLHRIEAYFDPENIASEKVLIKAGFTKEGLLRDYSFEKGKYCDAVVCSILRNEIK